MSYNDVLIPPLQYGTYVGLRPAVGIREVAVPETVIIQSQKTKTYVGYPLPSNQSDLLQYGYVRSLLWAREKSSERMKR